MTSTPAAPPNASTRPVYSETQSRKPAFIWPIVLFITAFGWVVLYLGLTNKAFAGAPYWFIFITCGLCLPFFIISLRVTIDVSADALIWRFRPVWIQHIPLAHIVSAEPRDYSPIGEYLGWGIRYTPWAGWAINLSGARGVQLRLASGRRVLLGTPNPEALADAINAARAA